jgi:putative acetyltransferase
VPRQARVGRKPATAIVVRRAEAGDSDAIWRIYQDESAYSGTLQSPCPSREEWRRRLAEPVEGDFILVACMGADVVGNAGLHRFKQPRRQHAMHLGLAVREDFQGLGVGSALMKAMVDLADGWLNVTRLELTVYADNARALALYRKFGFAVEGTHKGYALRDGRYVDAHSMARTRSKIE